MNQNSLVTIFFFALLLVILYFAFLILAPFLKPIAWGAILAIIVYPVYAIVLRLLRGRASAAALLVTLLITLVIVLPAIRIADFLFQEALELVTSVRGLVNGGGEPVVAGKPWLQNLLRLWQRISTELASFEIDLKQAVLRSAQSASGFLAAQATELAQNVFVFALNFLICLFSLFFFLRDGKRFCERIRRLLPMDHEHQDLLFRNVVNSVYAVIHGAVITAMIQGALAGFGYWLVGLPFAVLLGLATACTALFPIGGSSLIWLPASIYLLVEGTYLKGVILLVWGVGVVGTVDNFLKPLFIGTRLRLPVLFLFFSILGGLQLFGVLGLILGPVIFALLAALLDLYTEAYVKD